MVELVAKPPVTDGLPAIIGATTLEQLDWTDMWIIAPFAGQHDQVADGLGKLPKPNRSTSKGGVELVWFSRGQYMLMGARPDAGLAAYAALTDQSDAWCVLQLSGRHAEDVLARLVPVDLRQSAVKRGHCLRTQLNHMNVHITRTRSDAFRMMCFRSMAGTMVHEICEAMESFAARG